MMIKYNVWAISDWPENLGERLAIFEGKEFACEEDMLDAAHRHYDDLEIEWEIVG